MRLGQVEVGDEAHVGLVDAHAEGDGGDHDDAVLAQEAALVGGAHCGVQAGVVGQGVDAVARHRNSAVCLDLAPRQAVDDAGFAGDAPAGSRAAGARRCPSGPTRVADVGPVEGADEAGARLQLQALDDFALGRRVGGGGQGDARDVAASARAARSAGGTRGGSRGPTARRSGPRRWRTGRSRRASSSDRKRGGQQALGGDVEQVELAGEQLRVRPARRSPPSRRGVEERGAHAELAQRLDLVLHQRDQRRDHDARCPRAAGRATGSTATCRRRWASAPGRRRRWRHGRRSRLFAAETVETKDAAELGRARSADIACRPGLPTTASAQARPYGMHVCAHAGALAALACSCGSRVAHMGIGRAP